MESRCKSSHLPPGFRFHPTDEELIMYYLRNQANSKPCPVSIIPEVEIYKFDPWELPDKADGDKEWYFFSPRDRKYPNGARPNRATTSGYWKATGTDKAIYSKSKYVGVKKALVFYKGRPPKGLKTEWIMHEYRLGDSTTGRKRLDGSMPMRLDEWVLCRIYTKRHPARNTQQNQKQDASSCTQSQNTISTTAEDSDEQPLRFPRSCSISHLLEFDYASVYRLLGDDAFGSVNEYPVMNGNGGNCSGHIDKCQPSNMPSYQFMDSSQFQVNQTGGLFNQRNLANPIVEF